MGNLELFILKENSFQAQNQTVSFLKMGFAIISVILVIRWVEYGVWMNESEMFGMILKKKMEQIKQKEKYENVGSLWTIYVLQNKKKHHAITPKGISSHLL